MSITVNGQSCVPPGFRFHPTEEELLNYYLKKKVASLKIDLDVIRDIDLNKLEPWDIQEKCRIGSTSQNDWYFFSHKDKKYPTGTRTNRATAAGFWKATGRDKVIYASSKRIGMRKTLVFYKGRAPHGQKSDWIMHEYRLDDPSNANSPTSNVASSMVETSMNQEDGWVVCRVFKKNNIVNKASDNPSNNSFIATDAKTHFLLHSGSDDSLDQILQYMGRSCRQEISIYGPSFNERFMKLPALESPNKMDQDYHADVAATNWVYLDRLVASQLNGQSDASKLQQACLDDLAFLDHNNNGSGGSSSGDGDLWSLASSSADHFGHASHPSI